MDWPILSLDFTPRRGHFIARENLIAIHNVFYFYRDIAKYAKILRDMLSFKTINSNQGEIVYLLKSKIYIKSEKFKLKLFKANWIIYTTIIVRSFYAIIHRASKILISINYIQDIDPTMHDALSRASRIMLVCIELMQ